MTTADYERGFDEGFAAAIQLSGNRAMPANGHIDDANENIRKIAIGFPVPMFDRIRSLATATGVSFASAARSLIEQALASYAGR